MSRLKRRIRTRSARIADRRRRLADDIGRFRHDLRDRAGEPQWLAGAFGLGLIAGITRPGRRPSPPDEASAEPERPSFLSRLIREFGVPVALDLLQRYLSPPREEESEDRHEDRHRDQATDADPG